MIFQRTIGCKGFKTHCIQLSLAQVWDTKKEIYLHQEIYEINQFGIPQFLLSSVLIK